MTTPQGNFTQWAKTHLERYSGKDVLDGDAKLYALTANPMPAWKDALYCAQIYARPCRS